MDTVFWLFCFSFCFIVYIGWSLYVYIYFPMQSIAYFVPQWRNYNNDDENDGGDNNNDKNNAPVALLCGRRSDVSCALVSLLDNGDDISNS